MFRNLFSYSEFVSKSVGSKRLIIKLHLITWRVFTTLNWKLIVIGCLLLTENCISQTPKGTFLSDSIEIGKPIKYVLSYRHSPAQDVFFPDTSYNFYPFELLNRSYLPTETNKNGSLDSVIYTLETFDISLTQKLSLPVFVLTKRDCTAVYASPDSVYMKTLLAGDIQKLTLKTSTNPVVLKPQIDYARVIGYLLGLLLVAGLINVFFGKYLRKQYRLFLFNRRQRDFVAHFKRLTRGTLNDDNIGKALVLWKTHLEWLEKVPYTSYTTKEIIDHLPNERLEEALRDVDTAIYGGILSTQMPFAMNILLDTASEQYKQRRKELSQRLN